jgi:shikimate kinase
MMGVGKTTVGRLLAERLGWAFWDNDEALMNQTGKTAGDVQRADGESALHAVEDRLLREALTSEVPTVLAAAASVVLDPSVVDRACTVWLRASPSIEAQNIAHSGQHHRPLGPDGAAVLKRLSAARETMYASLADIAVDTDVDPATTCERVAAALAARLR